MARRSPGGVYKRPGHKGWWASLTTSCGTVRAKLCLGERKNDALERLGEALKLRNRGELTPAALDRFRRGRRYGNEAEAVPTLRSAFADFEVAKAAKKTLEKDLQRWRVLTEVLPADTPLKNLTGRRIDDAIEAIRRERALSPASCNRYRALLRSVLMLQVKRTELGIDPRDIRTTKEVPRERVLEKAEVDAFLAHVEAKRETTTHPNRRLWLEELLFATRLALFTAARIGELAALRWGDVDLRGGALHFRETKNGGARTVYLAPPAVELLRAWREARGKPRKADAVFVTNAENIGRRFRHEAEEADILDARFHDLRKTACSRMLDAGVDPRVVASISGHRDLTVLLRTYHRASDARRREAVNALGEAWS